MNKMKTLMDTEIPGNTDIRTLRAFLHGYSFGKYEVYTKASSGRISIHFECEEDATNFELKELAKIFMENFYHISPTHGVSLMPHWIPGTPVTTTVTNQTS